MAPHLHLHISFDHRGRRDFLFSMTLKSSLFSRPEGLSLIMSSRDVDILGLIVFYPKVKYGTYLS